MGIKDSFDLDGIMTNTLSAVQRAGIFKFKDVCEDIIRVVQRFCSAETKYNLTSIMGLMCDLFQVNVLNKWIEDDIQIRNVFYSGFIILAARGIPEFVGQIPANFAPTKFGDIIKGYANRVTLFDDILSLPIVI